MANMVTVTEGKRGCGYRKPGGLYLRCDLAGHNCGKLPLELHNCPVCNEGIKFSRSYKWINPSILFRDKECPVYFENYTACRPCALNDHNIEEFTKGLLIWIGDKHYSVETFTEEANRMGISRKIKSVPRGFEIGKDWVLLAHNKCFHTEIAGVEMTKAGIFMIFRPTRIEYVVKGTESEDELNALEQRGYVLVRVLHSVESVFVDDLYEVVEDDE